MQQQIYIFPLCCLLLVYHCTHNDWYYFDTNTNTPSDTCTSGDATGCKYGWLYDRTETYCTTYGCLNNSDVEIYGYWTASSSAFGINVAWVVRCVGNVRNSSVGDSGYYGVRPVIEILKSKLN